MIKEPRLMFREFFTAAAYYQPRFEFHESVFAAQRQGSAGPWHKVFAGWRRSKYFMSWSRVHPIVGHAFYPGTWILDYLINLCIIDFCKGPCRQRVMIRNVAKLSLRVLHW